MRRRDFIVGCASGVAAATVLRTEARAYDHNDQHLGALLKCKRHEVAGETDAFAHTFHTDCLRVDPSSLRPLVGRQMIADSHQKNASERKLVYFYYRQPQVVPIGNAAVVICNYEAGYDTGGGQIIEESGKSSHVVTSGGA